MNTSDESITVSEVPGNAETVSAAPEDSRLAQLRSVDGATLAVVKGDAFTELPTDLYIPPEAMEVFLDTFEGPLDLLLYLIRRENLDILNIRVAEITAQYMRYIELMHALQLELAGEYLLMAAMLAEIKSRMLLPKPVVEGEEEEDPRAELIRRLQEYEQLKSAAEHVDALPRMERELYPAGAQKPELVRELADPQVDMKELMLALANVLKRAEMFQHHAIQLEPLSVRERMTTVLDRVRDLPDFIAFNELFTAEEGRQGVIVTFLAIMELIRESLLDLVQQEAFAPIYVRSASASTAP
ncbi:MAG: ScpA family protein [Pseudomonadales bacterium]